jgi:MFS family permease
MATLAGAARPNAKPIQALTFMLGAAVFLNYVDRGAIAVAAPLMKSELHLSATAFGIAVSAFFWVYAPVQLFAGWLCDRVSVYKLMAGGIILWAVSTAFVGFVGGLFSLLILRVMLGVGESIAFPGSSKIIARHVPPEERGAANAAVSTGLSLGPAVGTLLGGLIVASWGWRAMFFVFGVATLLWLIPWPRAVRGLDADGHRDQGARVSAFQLLAKWPLWAMSIAHFLANYFFYFLLTWLPLYLTKERGFSITEMAVLATIGYVAQAACALSFGHFSDWWTRSGRSEVACRRWMVIGTQTLGALAIGGIVFVHGTIGLGVLLCLAGASTAALSVNLYSVAQIFAGPRAAGTWVGIQNALGNSSGIVGPIVSGIIVDRFGYSAAFVVTAVVTAAGALWWMVAIPHIRQLELS